MATSLEFVSVESLVGMYQFHFSVVFCCGIPIICHSFSGRRLLAKKNRDIFFLCLNPTPPAVRNPNYRGIACNPNYRGGKLKAASWFAAKETPQPTRLHRGSKPGPPLPAVPPLPLRQHSPRNYVFTNK